MTADKSSARRLAPTAADSGQPRPTARASGPSLSSDSASAPAAGSSRRASALDTRRGYGLTLVAGLLAATGVTVGVSRPWYEATATVQGLPTIKATAAGAELSPLAGALGVVILAAFGAVVATRGWVRRTLGIGICAAAVVVFVAALHPPDASSALQDGLSARGWAGGGFARHTEVWRWVVAVASVVAASAGAVVARSGAHWPTMGTRYDAPSNSAAKSPAPTVSSTRTSPDSPAATRERHDPTHVPAPSAGSDALTDEEVWREIDRGHDPTKTN